jgi:lipid-binding SYLF domain-containing protein
VSQSKRTTMKSLTLNRLPIAVATALLLAGLAPRQAAAVDLEKLKKDTTEAVEAFQKADSGLKDTFKKAAGYAVFPNVGKGGFVLGGAHGNGLVYEKGKLIGQTSLTQVTVGAQVGGQEFSEVVFFETTEALAEFKASKFSMSAQVSAVVAAEGASANAKYVNGVMVFTRAKQGLMAEASIGGRNSNSRQSRNNAPSVDALRPPASNPLP